LNLVPGEKFATLDKRPFKIYCIYRI